ncbi:uncharacterized [Tachysurus ichikawai]
MYLTQITTDPIFRLPSLCKAASHHYLGGPVLVYGDRGNGDTACSAALIPHTMFSSKGRRLSFLLTN